MKRVKLIDHNTVPGDAWWGICDQVNAGTFSKVRDLTYSDLGEIIRTEIKDQAEKIEK